MKRMRVLTFGCLATLLLAGASGTIVNSEIVIGSVVALVGAWFVTWMQKLYTQVTLMLDQFKDVLVALYGKRDPTGKFQGGGLIDDVKELKEGLLRHEGERTRREDRDGG